MKSESFLQQPSTPAEPVDTALGQDLLETLLFHQNHCVGMAANMIGVPKRIIAIKDGARFRVLYNPEIISAAGPYQTEEGCLSLEGRRPVKRFKRIKVHFQDEAFKPHTEQFTGYTAQIVQHEVDHCNGVPI